MSYYLQDHPNPNLPQFGWERAPLGQPGVHLSGVIGVHTSEAITDFEGVDNNAENNAAFIARRGEYGSYHTTGDADSILPLVHPRYAAWADTTNNAHAMSVSGCLQAARWLEMTPERRRAVVVNMAVAGAQMVQTAVRDGYLAAPTPAVRISPSEAISGSRPGFYGHGETNPGTRYDPGQHFDWNLFLSTYAAAIGGTITPTEAPKEWDEMASKEEIFDAVWGGPGTPLIHNNELGRGEYPRTILGAMTDRIVRQQITPLRQEVAAQNAQISNLVGAVAALAKGEQFDEAKLLAGVTAAAEAGVKNAIESIETTVKIEGK